MAARVVDLRSDTVTHPTPEMREAMYRAEIGDDVYGEDPSVNRLEEMTAELLGKEAALFLLSGTMGNLVGVLAQTRHGDEIIAGETSHVFLNEAGGCAALGGIQFHTIPCAGGHMDPADVAAAIRPGGDVHWPPSTLVCLENTHNREGGVVLTPQETRAIANVAHERGLRVHVDGARIFNAAVALDVPVRELVADVDSVTFCLSKGLSCPVGSLLAGSAEYIEGRARRVRKMIGGSLRQSGIVAAAGIYALAHMIDRLAEDHENAKRLAHGFAHIPGLSLEPERVETNIVFVDLDPTSMTGQEFSARLAEAGVKVRTSGGPQRLRFVTHYGITAADIEYALAAVERVLAPARVPAAV